VSWPVPDFDVSSGGFGYIGGKPGLKPPSVLIAGYSVTDASKAPGVSLVDFGFVIKNSLKAPGVSRSFRDKSIAHSVRAR
jgi:hypothetical protein